MNWILEKSNKRVKTRTSYSMGEERDTKRYSNSITKVKSEVFIFYFLLSRSLIENSIVLLRLLILQVLYEYQRSKGVS